MYTQLRWLLSDDSPERLHQFTLPLAVLKRFHFSTSFLFSDFWIFANLMGRECYLYFFSFTWLWCEINHVFTYLVVIEISSSGNYLLISSDAFLWDSAVFHVHLFAGRFFVHLTNFYCASIMCQALFYVLRQWSEQETKSLYLTELRIYWGKEQWTNNHIMLGFDGCFKGK